METQIDATAVQCGRWWSIKFMLGGSELAVQVHRLSQAQAAVRDLAASTTGQPESDFIVDVRVDISSD